VAVVNDAFVRRFLGTDASLGRELYFGEIQANAPGLQIIGVVPDTKYHAVREGSVPVVYVPLAQEPADDLTIYVWTGVPSASVLPSIRQQVASVNATLPVFNVRTLSQQVDNALGQERLLATLSSTVAIVALLLAVFGLYGIISYNVSRRVREIGLRMALGADRPSLLRLLLGQTSVMLLLGVLAGCTAASILLRFLREQLYGVSPLDPLTAIAAVAVVSSIGMAAGVIPAMRAVRRDPASVLRID
jgi:predicted lysophospholipase L1 biosynthesis ABC-type transport system permease subunit